MISGASAIELSRECRGDWTLEGTEALNCMLDLLDLLSLIYPKAPTCAILVVVVTRQECILSLLRFFPYP